MTKWHNTMSMGAMPFICGICGRNVASNVGYVTDGRQNRDGTTEYIYICPLCNTPNYFTGGTQIPAPMPGLSVDHVPEELHKLYNEARKAAGADAPTAAVLTCRKLLMNIAVSEGAEEGKSFVHYVDYLAAKNFVPPHGRVWVDHIRRKANEANHEIHLMTPDDAKELISFAEMLLKFIYEFPNRVPKPAA